MRDLPVWIAKDEEAKMIEPGGASRRGPSKICPAKLTPALEPGDLPASRGIGHRRIHQPCGLHLRGCETGAVIRTVTSKRFRIEAASTGALDDSILDAVIRVAGAEDGTVKPLPFLRRQTRR